MGREGVKSSLLYLYSVDIFISEKLPNYIIAVFDTGPLAAVFRGRKRLSHTTARCRLFGFLQKFDSIEKTDWLYLYSQEDEDLVKYLKKLLNEELKNYLGN